MYSSERIAAAQRAGVTPDQLDRAVGAAIAVMRSREGDARLNRVGHRVLREVQRGDPRLVNECLELLEGAEGRQ